MCGFNRLNDGVGINMFPLRRFKAISLMASICPLLACAIMSFRCFPVLLKQVQRKGKCRLTFECLGIFRRLLVIHFNPVEVPERKTILLPRCFFLGRFVVRCGLCEVMMLSEINW